MTERALDSSVAIALLSSGHSDHAEVLTWRGESAMALAGHALAETYAVLTRLPGDARIAPADVAVLLAEEFDPPLLMRDETFRELVPTLARHAIVGGAVYDALVGLAARDNHLVLATLDRRARATYEAVGATVEFVLT